VTAAPFVAAAPNVTLSVPVAPPVEPDTALTFGGAPGAPTITAADDVDDAPVPIAFVAVTAQVYDFPVVAPATVIGLALPEAERTAPPFDDEQVAV
jgi:hypothetical protein